MCKVNTLACPRISALKALKAPLVQWLGHEQVLDLCLNTNESDSPEATAVASAVEFFSAQAHNKQA